MARLTGASFLAAPVAAELALLARNSRRSARMAMAGALVAGALTVANFAYAAYAQMQLAAREAPHRKPAVAVVRPRAPLPDKVVAADSSAADSVAVAATTRDASQPPPQ
jgi:hypothetical protein